MMKVKVKVKDRHFSIPIPYPMIKLSIRVLTSKTILTLVNRSIEKKGHTSFQLPTLTKRDIKPLLNEISRQKGLTLVEIYEKNGTEVKIKL